MQGSGVHSIFLTASTSRHGQYLRLLSRSARRGALWLVNLLILTFFLFPFYWQTITAFKSPAEVEALPVSWFPDHLYWGNFRGVLRQSTFTHALLSSTVVATSTTLFALSLGSLAAYALAHLPLPYKRSILVGVLLVTTIPPIALVGSLFLVMLRLGLLDTYPALIIADLSLALPFAIWVLTNMFRSIPLHLAEQAEVDGCTPLQVLRYVVLPLAAPGLLTAGILVFITTWNEFLFALNLSMSARTYTLPVMIVSFGGGWGTLAAASELVTVPIILLVLASQRGIVQGLSSGAVKG